LVFTTSAFWKAFRMTMVVKATLGGADFHVGTATWCALADICLFVAPEICAACRHWYTNDGDGLDADRATQLAEALQARLSDGTVGRFIREKLAYANSLPDESCRYCAGTGIRRDAVGVSKSYDRRTVDEPGHPRFGQLGWCNGCGGRGDVRPFAAYYPLKDTAEVIALESFLKTSGGFRIW
jgi:hypothetical protein